MLDYLDFVCAESAPFNDVAATTASAPDGLASTRVPSCPDWNAADLTSLERPADDQLIALHKAQAARLLTALTDHEPHEALVHRLDAELAAETIGVPEISVVSEALAEDGINEILTVMLNVGELPAGLRYEASDVSVVLATPGRSWSMNLGRVIGETPSGRTLDEGGLRLLDDVTGPAATISASATDLNLWLWRRTELPVGAIDGDEAATAQLYGIAAIE
jgi:hypothetical protein